MKSCTYAGITPCTSTCWGPIFWKPALQTRDLGVLEDSKLRMSQEHTLVAKATDIILGYIRKSIASRSREVILPFCSALVRPYLEYCVQFCAPQYKRHTGEILSAGLECLSWLREVQLFSLEKGRLEGNLISVYKYFKGRNEEQGAILFSIVLTDRTRGDGC